MCTESGVAGAWDEHRLKEYGLALLNEGLGSVFIEVLREIGPA